MCVDFQEFRRWSFVLFSRDVRGLRVCVRVCPVAGFFVGANNVASCAYRHL